MKILNRMDFYYILWVWFYVSLVKNCVRGRNERADGASDMTR